jgi:hypothetical protein
MNLWKILLGLNFLNNSIKDPGHPFKNAIMALIRVGCLMMVTVVVMLVIMLLLVIAFLAIAATIK